MVRRSERAAIRREERRRADGALLDAALAPYLRTDARDEVPAEASKVEPVVVTLQVAAGRTIDLLRSPSRSAVVRVDRRPVAAVR